MKEKLLGQKSNRVSSTEREIKKVKKKLKVQRDSKRKVVSFKKSMKTYTNRMDKEMN